MKTPLSLFAAATLLGCHASTPAPTAPPQLWSDHKSLDATVEVCAAKAATALRSLGLTELVSQDHATYANHGADRAAVKCVATSTGASFVYFAVAGPEQASVEKLRNEIAWKF